jgi:hypothetical protein
VLDKHATVIASDRKIGSKIFYKNFNTFIEELERANYPHGYLENGPQKLKDAYWTFKHCLQQEVSDT